MKKKPLKDVTPLFKGFREHLYKHRKAFGRLQVLCRLEDYLTKEFAGFIIDRSDSSVLPILNPGKKLDGRRREFSVSLRIQL